MIDDLAVWLGCNGMVQDLTSCAVNTLLIYPGVIGLMSVFLLYMIAVPILLWMQVHYLARFVTRKLRGKRNL